MNTPNEQVDAFNQQNRLQALASDANTGLFDTECKPSFVRAIPYQCMVEIVADLKANPITFIQKPANIQKLIWAAGCLTALVTEMIKVNLLAPEDLADAFTLDDAVNGELRNAASDESLVTMLNRLSLTTGSLADYSTNQKAFGPLTAFSVLSALVTIWRIWRYVTGRTGGNNVRITNKIKLAEAQAERNS